MIKKSKYKKQKLKKIITHINFNGIHKELYDKIKYYKNIFRIN